VRCERDAVAGGRAYPGDGVCGCGEGGGDGWGGLGEEGVRWGSAKCVDPCLGETEPSPFC